MCACACEASWRRLRSGNKSIERTLLEQQRLPVVGNGSTFVLSCQICWRTDLLHLWPFAIFLCFSLKPVLSTARCFWWLMTSSGESCFLVHLSKSTVLYSVCVHTCHRSFLKQAEGAESVHCLIHTYTRCFLRELALVPHQVVIHF